MKKNKYLIKPDINDLNLTQSVEGIDEKKHKITTKVIHEKSLTIFSEITLEKPIFRYILFAKIFLFIFFENINSLSIISNYLNFS